MVDALQGHITSNGWARAMFSQATQQVPVSASILDQQLLLMLQVGTIPKEQAHQAIAADR